MACVKFISFLVALALANLVQSKLCDLENVECSTNGAKKIYKALLEGANGLVEPLDPIVIDKLVGEATGIKFTMTNGTLTGLKNCDVQKLKCKKADLSCEYNLHCTKLILYFLDEFKGNLGSLALDGIAEEKITLEEYNIIFKGKYALSVSEKDKKPRGQIKSYVLETEPKGKITFENTKLIRGDKKKMQEAYEFANKNPLLMEKLMKESVMEPFMKIFVDKVNIFMKEFPLADVLSED